MSLFIENRFKNETTGLMQTWLPCTITEISDVIRLTKKKGEDNELLGDDEQTPFRMCVITVETPVGMKTIDANLWEASRVANDVVFAAGKECSAFFDLEGAFAGSVWLGLPPKRNIDLGWFGVEAPAEQAQAEPKLSV